MNRKISSIDSEYCIRCSRIEPGIFSDEYLVSFLEYTGKGELKEASILIYKDHLDVERQWCRVDVWDKKNCLARISMKENGSHVREEFDVLLESIVKNFGIEFEGCKVFKAIIL